MKIKESLNIKSEKITMYGSTGTSIQWLWSKEDGAPNFALRRFVIEPGGQIGIHDHDEEHEIFILSGEGFVFNDSGEKFNIKANDTLYVPSNEPHGYKNNGNRELIFLCIIPFK
ncbi:MAG: cupin domain-containing protein [Candidatus Hodarchaeales archaeon]|jgi:quercetin dioxygenase-like cupin family protein